MTKPRKVFRIEKTTAAARLDPAGDQPQAPLHGEIMQQLSALRAMLASVPAASGGQRRSSRPDDVERIASELRLIHSAIGGGGPPQAAGNGPAAELGVRIVDELAAVIGASELATQKILAAAEQIDQAADNLSAALKSDIESGLAHDIRDRVIQIFEACNFQDLTSQRVAKVIAAFAGLERQIARALDELARADAAPSVHGPRLPDDPGHVSQSDVDSLFDQRAPLR
jgi:chemotaxis protein CheZ